MTYTPPGKRLFQARHRVSRKDLQDDSFKGIDWTTVQDVVVKEDFINYAVPVINGGAAAHAAPYKTSGSPTSSASSVFSAVDRYSNGTVESLVEGMDPVLKYNMQRNISVDSLIQENNKRISEHRDSLALLQEYDATERAESNRTALDYHQSGIELLETETRRELRRLRYENRVLLQREDVLTRRWQQVRDAEGQSDGALLISVRKQNLYWFGIPTDLRLRVYRLCLYSDRALPPQKPHLQHLGARLYSLLGDRAIVPQILANINTEVPWLFTASPQTQTQHTDVAVLETKLYGAFPGLYYHLRDKLQLNIFEQFMKPLLRTQLLRIIHQDVASLELLDILVVSLHYHELENVLLGRMLQALLTQCHFKFFHEDVQHIIAQISNLDIDVFRFLEDLRKPYADT